jgi:hypothetical protein
MRLGRTRPRITGGTVTVPRLLPERLDNMYRGHKLALWLFGLVVAIKSAQSLTIIFHGYATARDADGIPLDAYPPATARTLLRSSPRDRFGASHSACWVFWCWSAIEARFP